MWAALPLQPLKQWWPPNAATTTKPPPPCHSMVVDNFQNRQGMGVRGRAVVTALKSNEPQHRNAVKSKTKTKQPPTAAAAAGKKESEEQQQQRQLSGSDILMALQRATAQKLTKKSKQKSPNNNNNNAYAAATARENQGTSYFSNGKPLCIKPEWRDRLQELERRLEQLARP